MKKSLREKIESKILNWHPKARLAQIEGATSIFTLLAYLRQRKLEKVKAEKHKYGLILE